jgi:hypothetical protein
MFWRRWANGRSAPITPHLARVNSGALESIAAALEIATYLLLVAIQMLLRGANAVGYTSYPDNAVNAFVAGVQ